VSATAAFEIDQLTPPHDGAPGDWSAYVRGVVAGCQAHGLSPPAFDAVVVSTVPLGGGLSSSASLEVATATLVEAMTDRSLDPVAKALLCQQAEHEYAGVPCGILDQFTTIFARSGQLLLLDCTAQVAKPIPLADAGVGVLIVNTNVRHELSDGEYGRRRGQCADAANALGVQLLREVDAGQVAASAEQLGPLLTRRARHVVTENDRVVAAAQAARTSDWPAFGQLMVASHASLRDDYEVSCRELDLLVELATELGARDGVYGARLTGGGFGGCVVCLVMRDAIERVAHHLHTRYRQATGIEPTSFATQPAAGAAIL
jgi:galactokinase